MAKKKETKKKVAAPDKRQEELVQARNQFRALILSNPNYFGNLQESPFEPVLQLQANSAYEEIGCVGFQPQFNRLETVVFINQPSGYGGNICSPGTQEYVRFYLSANNGATWEDLGMTDFTVYDIPEGTTGSKRLEYATTLEIKPSRRFCFTENILKIRAILSWNNPPPPNQPNFTPVWGDIHNTWIQVEPFQFGTFTDLLKEAKIKLPPQYSTALDLNHPIPATQSAKLSIAQLKDLYKDKGVEPHRFAMTEIKKMIDNPGLTESLMAPGFKGVLSDLKIDWAEILKGFASTDGSVRYEELECVGLNAEQDTLAGVIRVKLPNGYSGNLCQAGSKEYVTFWADFNNNGTFETCLGTASVEVHDIKKMPKEGLEYAVFLPVNLHPYRRPCGEGPTVVRIRAILSWEVAPPCWNPNYIPTWGNREETLIHIYPGPAVVPGVYNPFLYSINNVGVCNINQTSGWATGDRPFGAGINITGEIPAAMALNTPDTLKYKVYVRKLSPIGPWEPLTNSFTVQITEGTGPGTAIGYPLVQEIDSGGYYTYREFGSGLGPWRRVSAPNRLLARWNTNSSQTGLWEIRVEGLDTLTNTVYQAGTTICSVDGTTRQNVKIRLDQQRPLAHLVITGYSRNGGPVIPASDCDVFQVGDIIHGNYTATDAPDNHFRQFNISIQPSDHAGGATVSPSSKSYYHFADLITGAGESGTWSLNTGSMGPCGYVVRLEVWDRTIVSGNFNGWKDEDFVGFCLVEPPS